MINCCMSGGARGADTLFGELATQAGHEVIHLSFEGHKTKCDPRTVRILTQDELNKADPHIIRANAVLERTFPTSNLYVDNMLRRNYYQILESERIYATCGFVNKLVPAGGTAWAIIMGINIGIQDVFVFDSTNDKWLTWNFMEWKEIEFKNIPKPEGIYAGIGSRQLTVNSENTIRSLYGA